jgi:hypothetical protein
MPFPFSFKATLGVPGRNGYPTVLGRTAGRCAKGYGSMPGTVRFLTQVVIASASPVPVCSAYQIRHTAKLG